MKAVLPILFTLFLCLYPSQGWAYLDELDSLLSAHVTPVEANDIKYNGVDYDRWSMDSNHVKVRKEIQKVKLDTLKTKEQKMAFWINAYNFFIVDLLIQKGERDGITDLFGAKSAWDRYIWSVDGDTYTLNDIKEKQLKPLNDPRVYFALACAGKSCPDLRTEAYRAEDIEEQLDDQVKRLLQNKTKGFDLVRGEINTVRVNEIFKWEEKEFNKGNIKSWLLRYFPLVINAATKIKYYDFDWSLNSQPRN